MRPPRPVWLTIAIGVAVACAAGLACALLYGFYLGVHETTQKMTSGEWFWLAWFFAAYLCLMTLSGIKDELREIARHLRELRYK